MITQSGAVKFDTQGQQRLELVACFLHRLWLPFNPHLVDQII